MRDIEWENVPNGSYVVCIRDSPTHKIRTFKVSFPLHKEGIDFRILCSIAPISNAPDMLPQDEYGTFIGEKCGSDFYLVCFFPGKFPYPELMESASG